MSDEEPDLVRTSPPLSRRSLLALGGSGFLSAMAGCQYTPDYDGEDSMTSGGDDPTATTTYGPDHGNDPNPEYPGQVSNFIVDDITTTSTEFDIAIESPDNPVSGEVIVYSSPTRNHDEKQEIGRASFEQSVLRTSHTVSIDPEFGYGQQFHYAISLDAPSDTSEEVARTTGEVLVPFRNEVEGEDMLRVASPRPTSSEWRTESGSVNQVELWMREPEESPFDAPAVNTEWVDPDWYDYRDIEVTALVRFATFQDSGSGGYDMPRFEWVKVHFELSEWEMLESFRWNSVATQGLESTEYTYGDGGYGEVDDPKDAGSMISNDVPHMVASEEDLPFRAYNKFRNLDTDVPSVNPFWFAASRPFCKRVAQEFEDALDNPSFNTLDGSDYYKATALKTFIGGSLPYGFAVSRYNKSPAEVVENWFTYAKQDSGVASDCVAATAFLGGVGVHLLDTPLAYIIASGESTKHALPALYNFELPSHLPRGSHGETGHRFENIELGDHRVALCEATKRPSTIGWHNDLDNRIVSRIQTAELNTHIPRNDDLEPEEGGEFFLSEETEESDVENFFEEYWIRLAAMTDAEER